MAELFIGEIPPRGRPTPISVAVVSGNTLNERPFVRITAGYGNTGATFNAGEAFALAALIECAARICERWEPHP